MRAKELVAEAVPADVGTIEGIEAIRLAVSERPRPGQTLIHAAAREYVRTFSETSSHDFDAVMATNEKGPYFLTQRLLDNFVQGAGVVFVSSMAAESGSDRHSACGVSKAALLGATTPGRRVVTEGAAVAMTGSAVTVDMGFTAR